jgi:hypothetical protein
MNNLLGENWRDFLPPEGSILMPLIASFATGKFVITPSSTAIRHILLSVTATGNCRSRLSRPLPAGNLMKEAAEEILTREIGRNELAAIEALHAYVDAQQSYFAMNQTYAQKIVSSEGKKDGLYWPASPGEMPSPLGPAFSPKEPGAGYHGYRFRILPDKNGFAMVAWPVSYGQTGVMSFVINQDDKVYQANLGSDSQQKAKR